MATHQQELSQNILLSSLPIHELSLLEKRFENVELPRRKQLELPNRNIEHVYFPTSGIVSIVANGSLTPQIEVGIIGREGVTGLPVILGDGQFPYSSYVQIAGGGVRIAADEIRKVMERSPESRKVFLHFVQSFLLQTSQTAVTNARATIAERLARWLLMAHDRVQQREINLTHEFLSLMMGSRRAGVTEGVKELERQGLVEGQRGCVVIINRAGLEKRAGKFYGLPEREYNRLLGLERSPLRKKPEKIR